jgi:hypothetical protein
MDSSINIIEDLQNNIIDRDCNCDNIGELNKRMALEKEVILNVNIRGLNANFNKLLVFIKSLVLKPCIIVCSETRKLVHPASFNIAGYKMYYNHGNINQNDGLVVYISEYINETTEILDINNLKIINTKIAIENDKEIILSALYRPHDIKKTEFIINLKKLIEHNKIYKNNLIMGDFNFDILNQETINQEFLHILLEHGYCPGFCNITRPSDKTGNSGTCIDNIFIKLDKIAYKTFTLRVPLFMSLNKIRTIENLHTRNSINYNKLRKVASTINWSELSQINNPNIALNNLIDKIKICLSKAEFTKKTNNTYYM